ncbi:MAG: hypothetical protein SPJ13_01210 [Bacteroidales bacterium]|nr:hypothetical protein [Bacteroidales bacterium]
MLKHEFEERIGKQVTDEEFRKAEIVYMDDSNTDKDTFCKMWKGLNEVAREYMLRMALQSSERRLKIEHKDKVLLDIAVMAECADENGIRKEIRNELDIVKVVRYLTGAGLTIRREDIERLLHKAE